MKLRKKTGFISNYLRSKVIQLSITGKICWNHKIYIKIGNSSLRSTHLLSITLIVVWSAMNTSEHLNFSWNICFTVFNMYSVWYLCCDGQTCKIKHIWYRTQETIKIIIQWKTRKEIFIHYLNKDLNSCISHLQCFIVRHSLSKEANNWCKHYFFSYRKLFKP